MQIITGDALEVLKTIPDACCSTCVTSPPYYGLRNYGEEGQIGLEETPGEYIERLVEVFREVRRVLKNDGTLWLNRQLRKRRKVGRQQRRKTCQSVTRKNRSRQKEKAYRAKTERPNRDPVAARLRTPSRRLVPAG